MTARGPARLGRSCRARLPCQGPTLPDRPLPVMFSQQPSSSPLPALPCRHQKAAGDPPPASGCRSCRSSQRTPDRTLSFPGMPVSERPLNAGAALPGPASPGQGAVTPGQGCRSDRPVPPRLRPVPGRSACPEPQRDARGMLYGNAVRPCAGHRPFRPQAKPWQKTTSGPPVFRTIPRAAAAVLRSHGRPPCQTLLAGVLPDRACGQAPALRALPWPWRHPQPHDRHGRT